MPKRQKIKLYNKRDKLYKTKIMSSRSHRAFNLETRFENKTMIKNVGED